MQEQSDRFRVVRPLTKSYLPGANWRFFVKIFRNNNFALIVTSTAAVVTNQAK